MRGRFPGVKYLLLIYNNSAQIADADPDALVQGHQTLYRELVDTGRLVSSAALAVDSETTTVRVSEGVSSVTDGPFLEAKEYLAGFYLVECESRQEAYEIATRIPCGAAGAVEIRPIDEQVTGEVQARG